MAVTGLNGPDFRTIADVRKRHLVALSDLFVQIPRPRACEEQSADHQRGVEGILQHLLALPRLLAGALVQDMRSDVLEIAQGEVDRRQQVERVAVAFGDDRLQRTELQDLTHNALTDCSESLATVSSGMGHELVNAALGTG